MCNVSCSDVVMCSHARRVTDFRLTSALRVQTSSKLSTAKANATSQPPSCPVAVYPLPKNASLLEQAVAESMSEEKTQRAAARDHGVNRVTLGEACKRALYVAEHVQDVHHNGTPRALLPLHLPFGKSTIEGTLAIWALRQILSCTPFPTTSYYCYSGVMCCAPTTCVCTPTHHPCSFPSQQ